MNCLNRQFGLFLSLLLALLLCAGPSSIPTLRAQDKKLLLGAGAPTAADFSPADVSGLLFWFKADQITASDGDAITTWSDQSGGAHDITQATSSQKAVFKTNIVNGKPVLRFGSDGVINEQYQTSSQVSWGQYVSVFWVMKYNGATGGIGYNLIADGSVKIFFHQFNNTTTPGFGGYDNANVATGFDQNTMTSGQFNVISSMRRNGNCEIYVNGATNGSTATSGTAQSGNAHLWVGGWNFGYLDGDIAEIVIYNADIGTTDRQRVEDYLGSKYGITITH